MSFHSDGAGKIIPTVNSFKWWSGENMGPARWDLGEIDGLLVPPGKASKLLTDHLISGYRSSLSPPRKSGLVKPSIHISLLGILMQHILTAMTS